MKIEVDQLPEELSRALFEALRLEIRYNRETNTATCRVTLTGPTITAASRTAHDAATLSLDDARQRRDQRKQTRRIMSHHPQRAKILFPSLGCPRCDSNAHWTGFERAHGTGPDQPRWPHLAVLGGESGRAALGHTRSLTGRCR
jgi:hypothetical protein